MPGVPFGTPGIRIIRHCEHNLIAKMNRRINMNGETLAAPRKHKRVASVEFWRFVFTVLVSLYHYEIFFPKRKLFLSGSSAVEFFFVLAGFTIAMAAAHKRESGGEPCTTRQAHLAAIDFIKKKIIAIWPVLLIWAIIYVATVDTTMLFGKTLLDVILNLEWELLFLVGTPFGFNYGFAPNMPLWFLTCLMVMGYIYTFAINRYYDFTRFAAPVIGIFLYILFGLETTSTLDHNIQVGLSTAGMVKGAAEMALGISMFQVYESLSKKEFTISMRVITAIIEIFAIIRLYQLIIGAMVSMDNYRRIIYIMIIVVTSFLNVTPLSRILDNKFSILLGKISLPMYITHYTLINFLMAKLMMWKGELMMKMGYSKSAEMLYNFLKGTGGYDEKFRQIPMSFKDAAIYLILVIAVAIVITLVIELGKRAYRDIKKTLAENKAAEEARKLEEAQRMANITGRSVEEILAGALDKDDAAKK